MLILLWQRDWDEERLFFFKQVEILALNVGCILQKSFSLKILLCCYYNAISYLFNILVYIPRPQDGAVSQ